MTVDVPIGGEQAVDQAVVDAEFVALVVAEQPWGEPRPSPRARPPRRVTQALPAPRSMPCPAASGDDRHPARATRGTRRRPDARTRSPPPRTDDDRPDEEVMIERDIDSRHTAGSW